MNLTVASSGAGPPQAPFACVRCSERKVKCDKQNPCTTCVRHKIQCIYRAPKPSRRRRVREKEALVDERLKRYEALLQENGIDPHQKASIPAPKAFQPANRLREPDSLWPAPNVSIAEYRATVFKPQLLQGQSGAKLVDNSLWSRLAEEIHDDEGTEPEDDSKSDMTESESSLEDCQYILNHEANTSSASFPPLEIAQRLWRIFVERVNPLYKIVHIPTLQPAMEKATANLKRVPSGFQALMFAIYSMAVVSLTNDECEDKLGEAKTPMHKRYVAATKTALARARFMSTTSIVVLQALLLHVLSIRATDDARAVWSLTGAMTRIAEGMGLGIDGTLLNISPFEIEIRRRIWWQIKMHDFRASELCGQAKFRSFVVDETTPKPPLNVNDSDLYPTMKQAPVESDQATEMLWCVFRSDLASFAAAQMNKVRKTGNIGFTSEEYTAMDDLKRKDEFIGQLKNRIETKYLRFCDPSHPLQFLTLIGGRFSLNLIRFVSHHPRRWANMEHVPASEQQLVWDVVLQILEQQNMMQSSPQLHCFVWNAAYFVQWHAVIHILDTLRAHPLHPDAEKAWQGIETLYKNNSDLLVGTDKPIFAAVSNLCLRAFSARVDAQAQQNHTTLRVPDFITALQDQRDKALERRKAALAKITKRKTRTCDEAMSALAKTTDAQLGSLPQPESQQNPTHSVQDEPWTGGDSFWVDDFLGGPVAGDGMEIDLDSILAQDFGPDAPSGTAIDWAQWDSWFG